MSTSLYYRRLAYTPGRGGIAKEGGLVLELDTPPLALPHVAEIDFGEVKRGVLAYEPFVREREGEARRNLTAPEIVAVRTWLTGLLKGAMRAAKRPPKVQERRRR